MYTAEDIKEANRQINSIDVKGKAYAMVNERIKAWRSICPDGSISTEIVSLENGVVTMKSTVRDGVGQILGTGFAQEKESSSFINKTSYIENCETSAVGRALGMCGIGIDDSVASAEELVNAINNQNRSKTEPKRVEYVTDVERRTYIDRCASLNVDGEKVLRQIGWKSGRMTSEQYGKALIVLKEIEDELESRQ